MEVFLANKDKGDPDKHCSGGDVIGPNATDTTVQLVISLILGFSAFIAFCFLRPRWKGLYAARKRRLDPRIGLPALPDSFLGWIPALYRISEEKVLASAGLDAFVFLAFFKMAIRLFGTMFIFAALVLEPINRYFPPDDDTSEDLAWMSTMGHAGMLEGNSGSDNGTDNGRNDSWNPNKGYLWAYLIFTYFFTILTLYFMTRETSRVIRVRQDYLGTQSTITDRTFQLSGVPKDIRTEDGIKELVEDLEIGHVESVTLCKQWGEIDGLIQERDAFLRKLEETWSVYLAQQPLAPVDGGLTGRSDDSAIVDEETGENGRLLSGQSSDQFVERSRPQARLWHGFLGLQSRHTDALDYYEEKLRRIDDKIHVARKKNYDPTGIAFVTMDSIAACQMAIQALIDPRPGQLQTSPAPAPTDVVWSNTYLPPVRRRTQAWIITIAIAALSVIWLLPVASLSTVINLCTLERAFPGLAETLNRHQVVKGLIRTGLPTVVVSILNIAIPYLYDALSNYQGMLSQGEIALSVISKVFFFTFFNIFLVFTLFGSTIDIVDKVRRGLKDTTTLTDQLANQIQSLSVFYLNFIMLQGIGLFPFRLLEFGSVACYPIYRMGAKTPRDFAELSAPPIFNFAFYLPTALLVFILCLVYSVNPGGYLVLLLGCAYFTLGHFTYKYQLLYAMDQPQHATGGAWRIICYRIVLGLAVFQLAMSGVLAIKFAVVQSGLILPLLIGTLWYASHFRNRFEPLTRFISLRSINREEDPSANAVLEEDFSGEERAERERLRRGSTIDEDREKGLKFVNPSLVKPLDRPWIYRDPPAPLTDDSESGGESPETEAPRRRQGSSDNIANQGPAGSNASSVSLGDTHVWRDGDA